MHINKLRVQNFKMFEDRDFEFNEDVNIIVGDNETGKSTILEAIEICLNLAYRGLPLLSALSTDLFNQNAINQFVEGDKSQASLPEILIEAYLDGDAELKGNKNELGENCPGIFVRICFDEDQAATYADLSKDPGLITGLPIEFYTYEWYSFAWNKLNRHTKKIECIFVDPPRLHPTYGTRRYISEILSTALTPSDRSLLNLNFRQLKQEFDGKPEVKKVNADIDSKNEVSDKDISISVNISSQTSWENNLQLNLASVPLAEAGKGEQHQTQIKLALWHKAKTADVVMIEEPENHLSHINLVKLIKYIEDQKKGQQVFLTTHSSYVLNKLSFEKLCLMADQYKRLIEIDPSTVMTLKRLPGYDTLRVVLAKKVVLVEGPSDELLLKKIYQNNHGGALPEHEGIDIIVVGGIGFKNYMNIAMHIGNEVHVVKDNDGDYAAKIEGWISDFKDYDFIKTYSPKDDNLNSLEPALIDANSTNLDELNKLAGVILSAQTKNKYDEVAKDIEARTNFLREWFSGENKGGKKVDSALRVFETDVELNFPDYLNEALDFGE